jgi:hypothetical protein
MHSLRADGGGRALNKSIAELICYVPQKLNRLDFSRYQSGIDLKCPVQTVLSLMAGFV